jgi:glycosyltransferase involved in cell wall biosynthesis
MPLVSVVLPVYNAQRYIAAALESVLGQSMTDLEVIAIDDGSSDGSLAEMERIAAADARVKLVSRPNRGLVATLNEGVAAAGGEWIARMDADDVSLPERFATQLELMNSARVDVCGSAVANFGTAPSRVRSFPSADAQIKFRLLYDCPLAHPSVMARAELLKRHPYRATSSHAEDYELWSRLAMERATFANVPVPLLRYRRHAGQISVTHRAEQSRAANASARTYVSWYLAEHGLADLEPLARAVWQRPEAPDLAAYAVLLRRLEARCAVRDPHIDPHLCATAAVRGIGPVAALALLRLIVQRHDAGGADVGKLLVAGLLGRSFYRGIVRVQRALADVD